MDRVPNRLKANMSEAGAVVPAYTVDHVVRLTGLTRGQLLYWDRTGFFSPTLADDNRRLPYSRVYSFKDIVGLRVISVLLNRHRVTLHHLKMVARELTARSADVWADIRLYVLNRHVQFKEPETGQMRGVVDGQYAIAEVVEVIQDMQEATAKLRERSPEKIGTVERHRHVAHNAWVFGDTRIPIRAIVAFHNAGYSIPAILQEYPSLTEADIQMALSHTEPVAA